MTNTDFHPDQREPLEAFIDLTDEELAQVRRFIHDMRAGRSPYERGDQR